METPDQIDNNINDKNYINSFAPLVYHCAVIPDQITFNENVSFLNLKEI